MPDGADMRADLPGVSLTNPLLIIALAFLAGGFAAINKFGEWPSTLSHLRQAGYSPSPISRLSPPSPQRSRTPRFRHRPAVPCVPS